MSATAPSKLRKRAGSLRAPFTQDEKDHHLTGAFAPQTPLGSLTPNAERSFSPSPSTASFAMQQAKRSPWVRWAVDPALSFKILLVPVVLYLNWEVLSPYVTPGLENPFGKFFLLDGRIESSSSSTSSSSTSTSHAEPLYRKTYWDLAFIAYYIVFFSCTRQLVTVNISTPIARYFGLRKEAKIDRFGEQHHAFWYFGISGACGVYVMSHLPIWWYNSPEYWTGYPFWAILGIQKRYYLMQFAHWCQELLVLGLGLEKPRKDYTELVAHHFVTIFLVGASYLANMTPIGVAVFVSMDIPDSFFAFSKMLNYIQWNTAKVYSFGVFFVVWSYFRHYLNFRILWSVWTEFKLIPYWAQQLTASEGLYMAPWVRYVIFVPLALLQGLNLFWYNLILKVLWRGIVSREVDDSRSDDEDDGEENDHED